MINQLLLLVITHSTMHVVLVPVNLMQIIPQKEAESTNVREAVELSVMTTLSHPNILQVGFSTALITRSCLCVLQLADGCIFSGSYCKQPGHELWLLVYHPGTKHQEAAAPVSAATSPPHVPASCVFGCWMV